MNNKSTFNFKKFKVKHDKCAMKIGTDGVLLGAWVGVENKKSILDVGTGTGLIAMMVAQRNNSCRITGLELDEDASIQAQENVKESLFKDRIEIKQGDFNSFIITNKVDLIVSNPPFFIDGLKTPKLNRTQARHTDSLSPQTLFERSFELLNDTGELAIIFPSDSDMLIMELAQKSRFYLKRKCAVYPTVQSDVPKRTLWQFSKLKCEEKQDRLVIEKERHIYTKEYIALTKDFYLKM